MPRHSLVPWLAASALLCACDGPGGPGGGVVCTTEAMPSVRVSVVDTAGNFLREALVTYSVEGGPELEADCIRGETPFRTGCDAWVAEYETPGEFLIRVKSTDGKRTVQEQVTVQKDLCHVQTQILKLTLPD